jgi:hypothetical protein
MDLDKILYTILQYKTSIKLKFSAYLNSKISVWYEKLIKFSHFCHPTEIWYVASICTAECPNGNHIIYLKPFFLRWMFKKIGLFP